MIEIQIFKDFKKFKEWIQLNRNNDSGRMPDGNVWASGDF